MKYNTNKLKESIEFISVLDNININYKKQGKNHIVSCPFHDEKTPSCMIDNNKNTFHCFGCNESGDIITFIEKYYNLSFMDAVKWLVREFNLENIIEENEEERFKRNEKENGLNLMNKVKKKYHTNLLGNEKALEYLHSRGITMETIQKFEIGYAPDEFNYIVQYAKEHQEFDLAVKCGLILVNERNRDFFINRIIIPIHDRYGQCIAFGGRIWEEKQEVKKEPKYINSPETYLYEKNKVLYGLNHARNEIRKKNEVILVEGYFDVMRSHQENLQNIVASCGTSITEEQIKILISISNSVIMAGDNDKAGQKSIKTNIDEFYKLGMSRLEIVQWSDKIKDIDDFWTNNGTIENLYNSKMDALEWLVQDLTSKNPNLYEMNALVDKLALLISYIKEEFIRDSKIVLLGKLMKVKPKIIDTIVKKHLKEQQTEQDSNQIKYPSFFTKENIDEMEKHGFAFILVKDNASITGIYFKNSDNAIIRISNFVLKPLYHVKNSNIELNKRLFIVENHNDVEVIEFESGTITSTEKFTVIVNSKNNFMWFGTTFQLKKVMVILCENINRCFELRTLGWQNEGFFAYNDLLFQDGELIPLNEYGIGKINDKLYYSPSQSIIYKDKRDDSDEFESINIIKYNKSKISFEEWCELMNKVYPDHGKYAILYIFICIFRDIVLKIDGSCPHLYAWGIPGSGKSKFMESINSFFYVKQKTFSLHNGTDYALSRFLEVFKNCFCYLNEVDDSKVPSNRIQILKGAYDNEGRQRGKIGSKNMTETMKVNSALGLSGQRVISNDDNALAMRCIVRGFLILEDELIPDEQRNKFAYLKKLEEEGGFNSLIMDIIKERDYFENNYSQTFSEVFDEIRQNISDKKYFWSERIARNYCYLLTMHKLAQDKFKLPFSFDNMKLEIIEEIHKATKLHSSTDDLSKFWRIVSNSIRNEDILKGLDFTIEEIQGEFKLDGKIKTYEKPTRLLFIRLSHAHMHYRNSLKKETNEIGMEYHVLSKYFVNKIYFEGTLNQKRFTGFNKNSKSKKSMNSSCHVFNYDTLKSLGYNLNYTEGN